MENITFAVVSLGDIVLSGSNPRIVNQKTQSFADLVESIKAGGIRVPVMVRPHPKQKNKYELLAGNRRIVAAQAAKIDKVPCNIHPDISDEAAFDITFFENFGREDLTPLEEGKAAVISLEKYKGDVKAAASKLGKSEKWILQRAAIEKNLCDQAKKEFHNPDHRGLSRWTASHLQQIAGLPADLQMEFIDNYCYQDVPSVKDLENEVMQLLRPLSKAPWQFEEVTEITLCNKKLKVCCSKCTKRSSFQPGLFDDSTDTEKAKKDDKCLDDRCWKQRVKAYIENKAIELKKEHPKLQLVVKGHHRYDAGGREFIRMFDDVLCKGDYKICKKDNKNAIPALVVNGQGIGQVEYIEIPKSNTSSSSAAPKEKVKTMTEKKKELESKRQFSVLRQLMKALSTVKVKDLKTKDPLYEVLKLACFLGTDHNVIHVHNGSHYGQEVMHKYANALKDKSTEDLTSMLFQAVIPNLIEEVTYNDAITRTPKENIEAGKAIADLLQLDIDAMYKEACEEYPVPKAWKAENENKKSKTKK